MAKLGQLQPKKSNFYNIKGEADHRQRGGGGEELRIIPIGVNFGVSYLLR